MSPTRIVACSDLHIPIHEAACLESLIHRIRVWHPHLLVLVGDVIDMESISRFGREPGGPSLQAELDVASILMGRIRHALGKGRMVILGGNHEARLTKLIQENPGLHGLRCLTVPSLLGCPGTEYHPDGEAFVFQGCHFQHSFGDKCSKPGDQEALRRLTSAGADVQAYFTGHSHRLSTIYCTYPGGTGGVYELGCLIDRFQAQKQYMHLNPMHWIHSWTEIVTDGLNYPKVTQVVLP